jgi:short-subunit dehydrogenase
VVLSGRRVEELERLAAELGGAAQVLVADLTDAAAVRELAERAGAVDVLVANAALPGSGEIDDYTPEQIDRAIAVNLTAPVHLAHALIPGMRSRGRGHLVFVNSMSGKVASAGGAMYSATKFGLRGFAFALREDLRGSGVGVSSVFPFFVSEAGMFVESKARLPRGVRPVPVGRVAAKVVQAIERDRAEVDVAPLFTRIGAWSFNVAPNTITRISSAMGGRRVAQQLADAQRDRR